VSRSAQSGHREKVADGSQGELMGSTELFTYGDKLKLPNMNEFSPGVLKLGIWDLLHRIAPNQGRRAALVDDLQTVGSLARTQDPVQRAKRTANVLIGMSECGLFDLSTNTLTSLGLQLLNSRPDEASREFASHILRHLHGTDLVAIIQELRKRGEAVTNDSIRRSLRARGFTVTENESNFGKLRQWLEPSGVVDSDWHFDDDKLRELSGLTSETVAELTTLTTQQRVFLNKLREQGRLLAAGEWPELGSMWKLIHLEYGREFLPEGKLREKVLVPLEAGGWIQTRGIGGGRGGNAGQVLALDKLNALRDEIPLPDDAGIPPDLRARLSTPLDTIFDDLESWNNHEKGMALELLALNILTQLGLRPVGFRTRAAETAFAETDLTANGLHLHYSRWLVQCKNVSEVKQDYLTREVGLAVVIKAHVILMITTGTFAASTRVMAEQTARATALQVLLLDGQVLKRFRTGGINEVVAALRQQGERVLQLKKPQEHEA
jgi:hypothetical protein